MRAKVVTALTFMVALQWLAAPLPAQSMAERLKQKAQEAADKLAKKTEEKVDQGVDKAIDKLDECLFTDTECIKKAKADGKKVALKDEDGNAVNAKGQPLPLTKAEADAKAKAEADTTAAAEKAETPIESKPTEPIRPPADAWANFDFVPGNKVLFADDFSKDRVGNFPQRLELVAGNLEVVDWQGARWVRGTGEPSRFDVPLPQLLPLRFTLEFDIAIQEGRGIYQNVHAAAANEGDAYTALDGGQLSDELPTSSLFLSQYEAGVGGGNSPTAKKAYAGASGGNDQNALGRVFRIRLQADGRYLKMYVNEDRVANIPNGNFGRTNKLRFSLNGSAAEPIYVGNIVVAAGGSQFYDALLADGRVATQGIFFDTGSDRIKTESSATLKLIGDMLKEHADLKLMIEGHTDNVGSPASNKALSEKRAAAVRAYLTANFGVDGARLQSSGLGDTKPAAPNTTNEGRQQNRRVELVKM